MRAEGLLASRGRPNGVGRIHADALALLYIEGHVRPYHETTHAVAERYVPRWRLCMPATTNFWVNQPDAPPLFVVTGAVNDRRAMPRREILPEVRRLVGDRGVTLGFGREGWSPKFFRACHGRGSTS